MEKDLKLIQFGSYFINSADKKEPLEWDVLEVKDGKALLITHDIIDVKVFLENDLVTYETIKKGFLRREIVGYNKSDKVPSETYANNYEYSTIREWLNNDFYKLAFTEDEASKIQEILVDNSTDSNGKCNDTKDNIFILSSIEAEKYIANKEHRIVEGTPYAIEHKKNTKRSIFGWWVRTPFKKMKKYPSMCSYVNNLGDPILPAVCSNEDVGVRPACWIKLD